MLTTAWIILFISRLKLKSLSWSAVLKEFQNYGKVLEKKQKKKSNYKVLILTGKWKKNRRVGHRISKNTNFLNMVLMSFSFADFIFK